MAGQSQRWGYVQQNSYQQQQQQQQQLGRQESGHVATSSSVLELLAASTPSFTAAVSVAGVVMLPSSSSSSSSVSDTDASTMDAMKADPLDLTCNSQSSRSNSSNGSGAGGGGANSHGTDSSMTDSINHSVAAGQGARIMFNSNDCDTLDRSRMASANATSAMIMSTAPTGNSTMATGGVIGGAVGGGASTGGNGEEAHRCDMCGKTFAVPARLTRHYRTHTGERPFVCEVCGKSFSVKENLSVHRRIHTKEKPYRCPHCGRGFEHSGKLHRHMRIHTGERPHQCSDCGKTFIQSGQLVIHMRSHTGEKPYVCNVCNKGFTCSKQLKVHSRTHTGERPYACDVCGKTFAYNHVLKLHQMAHLGERLYKCTICSETYSSKKTLEAHIKMHGVSPTRQSPVPSTSSGPASAVGIASSSAAGNIPIQHGRPSSMAVASAANDHHLGRRPVRHNLSSGGGISFIEQANRRMAGHSADGITDRMSNHRSLSPSSESSRSSPSELDGIGPSAGNGNNLLMEAQRHFPMQQHPAGMPWNMLNGLGLSRAAVSHHLAQSQFEDSQQLQQPGMSVNLQERAGSNFAYPQLLNATRERLAGIPVAAAVDPKNGRHNFGGHLQPFKQSSNQQTGQSSDREFSPMTYLRPMPPLIPVTVAGPLMATSPTSLRSLERLAGHSAPDASGAVPPALRQLDGSSTSRGPPRKSSRFRGGEGSGSAGDGGANSESSDSPHSSASSSPSLMTDVATDSQGAPIPDPLRSTSVIRFAHRPSSSSSPTSSK